MEERPVDAEGRLISRAAHYGHCSWTLLHATCYAVESLSVESGDAHASPRRFAQEYLAMVKALVAVYPCSACRRHARVALPEAIARLEADVAAVDDDAPAADVADALAIAVFRMHNTVRRGQDARQETANGPRQRQDYADALHQMEVDLESGARRREEVAQYLRSLWSS